MSGGQKWGQTVKKALNAVFMIAIFVMFLVAIWKEEDALQIFIAVAIVILTLAACSIGKPSPQGISDRRTRKSLDMPSYVVDLMMMRWAVLILFGLIAAGFESHIIWSIGIAGFLVVTEYASRQYHREDPVGWEIAFHNEVDGYSNSDGDGDGD